MIGFDWIIGLAGSALALVAVWFGGKVTGRKEARKEQQIEELNRHIATSKELDDVFRKIDGMSDDDILDRLRERTGRKP